MLQIEAYHECKALIGASWPSANRPAVRAQALCGRHSCIGAVFVDGSPRVGET